VPVICRLPALRGRIKKSYDTLVSYLETSLDRVAVAKPNPGRTDTFRRLNRTEYKNVIRDLLALDVDVDALLPSDDSSHGFDNVTLGDLSPTLLERYLTASYKISRLAVGSPISSPGADVVTIAPDLANARTALRRASVWNPRWNRSAL
jgi:hypothetical protein